MRGRLAVIIFCILFSCIDPVNLKLEEQDRLLVFDGQLTDLDEQQPFKLGRSLSIDQTRVPPVYFVPEAKATITIIENESNRVTFKESTPGTYLAPAGFKGVVGNQYRVEILTKDGEQYQSAVEEMQAYVYADTLPYEYVVYERFVKNAAGDFVVTDGYGFQLWVTVNDPPVVRNYYKWKVRGIFEFFSLTENPEANHCWAPVSKLENSVLVKDDGYINGQSFTEPLVVIPYDRVTYYLAIVQQQSITSGAYNFWSKVRQQQLSTGSIFDPTPSPVQGNIVNVSNSREPVLGYFGVASVTEIDVLINRFPVSGYASPPTLIPPIDGDCRTQVPLATNKKPKGFL